METNSRIELARKIIEQTGNSLFLTGKAGTGKTTFLRKLRAESRKRMVVCAPTGIAAINAGGMTLHSFFQLDFGPFVPGVKRENASRHSMAFSKEKIKIIRGMDVLVIDEISMVRSDLLDAVDDVLRRFRDRTQPFGGVQLLLIGDLQQLPPVVVESERRLMEENYRSPYFFDSHALSKLDYVTIELDKVYRQNDGEFLDILNAVRDNRADASVLARLNSRYEPGFNPADSEGYVRITTHNHLANDINRARMYALPTESHYFQAQVEGNFPENSFPADKVLELKEGAQVMFIKNDTGTDRRFFNGMLGRVTAIDEDGILVTASESGEQISVEPMEWENVRFVVNEETKEITEQREGAFRQLPLRPAWAITIHKSQGLTFDRAIIDTSMSFTHGQTYVALSRCRTLEGLVLDRPVSQKAIINDPMVTGYLSAHSVEDIPEADVSSMIHAYQMRLAEGIFDFRPLFSALEGVKRLLQENFMKVYPAAVSEFVEYLSASEKNMVDVGERFKVQLQRLYGESGGDPADPRLCQRVKDACVYFRDRLQELMGRAKVLPTDHDNRKVVKKLRERMEMFEELAAVRMLLLSTFAEEDFNVNRYLDVKAEGAFRSDSGRMRSAKKRPGQDRPVKSEMSEDNVHPEMFDRLRAWRHEKANGQPEYTVLTTKTLLAISNYLPRNFDDLLRMPGIGAVTLKKYGDELLDLVDEFMAGAKDLKLLSIPDKHRRRGRKNETSDAYMPEKESAGAIGGPVEEKPAKVKKPKNEKPRPVAGDSSRQSWELFKQGRSIDEIATIRDLKPSTIESHILERMDFSDRKTVDRLVPAEMQKLLIEYLARHTELPSRYTELREDIQRATGVMPEFIHIRTMLGVTGRQLAPFTPAAVQDKA